jgi:hypothetical protein
MERQRIIHLAYFYNKKRHYNRRIGFNATKKNKALSNNMDTALSN